MIEQTLTRRQAAKYMGVCYNTILDYEKKGFLHGKKSPINGYVYYDLSDIIMFMRKKRGI